MLLKLYYDLVTVDKYPLRDEDKYNMTVRKDEYVDGVRIHFNYETIAITDEFLDQIMNVLNSGVRVISCGRESISFSLWSSLSESRGVIYSRTEKAPSDAQLIEVRQLSEENW